MNELTKRLEMNPIIAAVKQDDQLSKATRSMNEVVFLLGGDLINIKKQIDKLHEAQKIVFIHFDLIDGLSKNMTALQYVNREFKPDGIITTKASIAQAAKKLGLLVVYRCFIIDSISLENTKRHVEEVKPDAVEILPGVIDEVIGEINEYIKVPIIAGGLINKKEHVVNCIRAGAVGISTTREEVWGM